MDYLYKKINLTEFLTEKYDFKKDKIISFFTVQYPCSKEVPNPYFSEPTYSFKDKSNIFYLLIQKKRDGLLKAEIYDVLIAGQRTTPEIFIYIPDKNLKEALKLIQNNINMHRGALLINSKDKDIESNVSFFKMKHNNLLWQIIYLMQEFDFPLVLREKIY